MIENKSKILKNCIQNRAILKSTAENCPHRPCASEPIRPAPQPTPNHVRDQLFRKNAPESPDLRPLKIVLWDKSKTKKLLDFVCASGPDHFSGTDKENHSPPNQQTPEPKRSRGKIKVKVLRSGTGQVRLKFQFETPNSSTAQKTHFGKNLNIKWKSVQNDLRFKLDLDEHLTKTSWQSRFGQDNPEGHAQSSRSSQQVASAVGESGAQNMGGFRTGPDGGDADPPDPPLSPVRRGRSLVEDGPSDDRADDARPNLSRFVDVPGEFDNFGYLHKFLYKLFMEIGFDQGDFCLQPTEREIVLLILKKKGFIRHDQAVEFSPEFMNSLRSPESKKKEDGLKFVFKKALNHLMNTFRAQLPPAQPRPTSRQFERQFYSHYFGRASRELHIPLERFYHFRNWRNRFSEFIPKSITKQYVADIKLSEDFMRGFRGFLRENYFTGFFDTNMNKIKSMVGAWDRQLTARGHVAGLQEIRLRLFSSGNKMPWTLAEARQALEHTFEYLK